MIHRRVGVAAAAVAAVALLPWPVAADVLADVEREAARLEERVALVESQASAADEPPAARALRVFSEGEMQYLLGDWRLAAILLASAVDEPAFRPAREYPFAVFYLADALRRQGAYAAARVQFDAYVALGAPERRADALAGAIECGVKLRHPEAVEPLVAEAERAFGGNPPPEVRYLAAKALSERTDLPEAERIARATAAFDVVPAPYRHQARYYQGVLELDRGDLASAARRFELCADDRAADERQREVQDLCALAMARLHADQGRAAEAIEWYERVPRESPHFDDAMYEIAWAFVRAGQLDAALRTASLITDLSPDSQVAPDATVLEGHLLLRLGRYAEATEAYSHVINTYAPVRDELEAVLSMRPDASQWGSELGSRDGGALDVSAALPPVAVRWAAAQRDAAGALALVADLDASRKDVDEADAIAARVDALLARGDGLDAFPREKELQATAQALENAAAVLDARAADAAFAAVAPALAGPDRGAVEALHAERVALGVRIEALPRSGDDVRARAERLRLRAAGLEREAFQLGYDLEGAKAAITGAEAWLEEHRAELAADAEARAAFAEELRKHRAFLRDYEAELRGLRQDVDRTRDGAAGAEALAEEARLRGGFAALVARERAALEARRAGANAGALAILDRAGALGERLEAARRRAQAASERIAADAVRRTREVREQVARERSVGAEQAEALAAIRGEAQGLVGRIAHDAFARVRTQFYQLVLKADVGLVDVAWARKRARLDKIQLLSRQKTEELKVLEDDYQALLWEGESP